MKKFPPFLIFIMFFINGALSTGWTQTDTSLRSFENIRHQPRLMAQLEQIIQLGIQKAFGKSIALPNDLQPIFKKSLAVFVTVKKNGEVRACMGSLRPQQENLAKEIVANLKLAFFEDPRHRPVQEQEIDDLEFYITAVGRPVLIKRVDRLNPARDAVLLRYGKKEGVVLPGEAKTMSYLIKFARAKAGIKKGEPFQVYRIPAVTQKVN